MSAQCRPRRSLYVCVCVCVCVSLAPVRISPTVNARLLPFQRRSRETRTRVSKVSKHAFPRRGGGVTAPSASSRDTFHFFPRRLFYSPCVSHTPALRNRVRLWQTVYELCKVIHFEGCFLVTRNRFVSQPVRKFALSSRGNLNLALLLREFHV